MIKTKHRQVNTVIPAPGTFELIERLARIESRSMHGQLPIVWKRALDFNIYDIADNKFIDFTSSIFVANTGHSNPNISSAISSCLKDEFYILLGGICCPVSVTWIFAPFGNSRFEVGRTTLKLLHLPDSIWNSLDSNAIYISNYCTARIFCPVCKLQGTGNIEIKLFRFSSNFEVLSCLQGLKYRGGK